MVILSYSYFLTHKKKVEDNHVSLDEGQQRVVTTFLRTPRNGGVGLKVKEKERFNAVQLRLAELGNKFRLTVRNIIINYKLYKPYYIHLFDHYNYAALNNYKSCEIK